MKYRYFFWDFDGTLYDTYQRIARAALKGLEDTGLPRPPYEEAYPLIKQSLDVFSCHYANEAKGISAADIMAGFHAHSEDEGPETIRPYAGVGEMLRALGEAGGRHYLYTHRGPGAIEWLQRDGLWPLFEDGVTSADGFPAKPAPDALLSLVQKHGLPLASCIMVGDRGIDVDAGKNAGMDGALFDPEGFYTKHPATLRASSVAELQELLLR